MILRFKRNTELHRLHGAAAATADAVIDAVIAAPGAWRQRVGGVAAAGAGVAATGVRKHGASLWLQRRPRGLLALTDRLLTAYAHPANPPNEQEKERPEADPRIGIHPECRGSPGYAQAQ